jgi:hypothetical protein
VVANALMHIEGYVATRRRHLIGHVR